MDTIRSEQIKAGLQKSFHSGKSAKASTVCYGYRITAEGDLMVYPAEAIYRPLIRGIENRLFALIGELGSFEIRCLA